MILQLLTEQLMVGTAHLGSGPRTTQSKAGVGTIGRTLHLPTTIRMRTFRVSKMSDICHTRTLDDQRGRTYIRCVTTMSDVTKRGRSTAPTVSNARRSAGMAELKCLKCGDREHRMIGFVLQARGNCFANCGAGCFFVIWPGSHRLLLLSRNSRRNHRTLTAGVCAAQRSQAKAKRSLYLPRDLG